jgi:hypothetical protein
MEEMILVKDMEKASTSREMDASWPEVTGLLSVPEMVTDCIEYGPNIDGTLDYTPVPLAIKNLWLFKNGGERNEVC